MKKDVQIGVILGVIILAIIGVFLSTRTAVKEPAIPIPEQRGDNEVAVLNINDLSPDAGGKDLDSFKDAETRGQETDQKEPVTSHVVKKQEPFAIKDDAVIEGECEKPKSETGNILTKRTVSSMENEDFLSLAADNGKSSLVSKQQQSVSQKTKKGSATPSLSLMTEKDTSNSTGKKHTIQQGDSLYKIALKYYNDGSKWNKILDANKSALRNKNALKVGQEIIIPEL
ncbi:MAG: LysM peptidoglycan-binding domain-containing protein [Candidatus Brocadiaceae bacterium]